MHGNVSRQLEQCPTRTTSVARCRPGKPGRKVGPGGPKLSSILLNPGEARQCPNLANSRSHDPSKKGCALQDWMAPTDGNGRTDGPPSVYSVPRTAWPRKAIPNTTGVTSIAQHGITTSHSYRPRARLGRRHKKRVTLWLEDSDVSLLGWHCSSGFHTRHAHTSHTRNWHGFVYPEPPGTSSVI